MFSAGLLVLHRTPSQIWMVPENTISGRTKTNTEKWQLTVSEVLTNMKDNSLVVKQTTNVRLAITERHLHSDGEGNSNAVNSTDRGYQTPKSAREEIYVETITMYKKRN